ncbi:MAG: hypothetical protein ACQETL_18165 [Bacteroidota bacterium]
MTEIFFSYFNKKNSDYFLTLFLSGIIFWVVNFFGLGYTKDSNLYVEIAKEINSTSFFLVKGFNIKPPVLPILISFIGEQNMVWVNFFCYLCIQGIGVYLSRKIKDDLVRFSFLLILVFATPHILISSFLWTEPLFLAIMLFSFYFLDRFYQTNQLKFIVSAIILLSILPFIRFAAIFLIFPLMGFLILMSKSKYAISASLLFLALIFIGWAFVFQEGFSGRWDRFIQPILSGRLERIEYNFASYSKALSSWFFPYALDGFFSRLISISILLFMVFYNTSRIYVAKRVNILYLSPLLFLIYFVLMLLVFKVEYYAAERYIAIFYLLIILNIFLQIDNFIKSSKSFFFKWGFYFLIIAFTFYSFLRTIKNVHFWYNLRSESVTTEILDIAVAMFM